MNTLHLKVTKIVLVLAILVGAGSLFMAMAQSNELSATSAAAGPSGPIGDVKVGPQLTTEVQMVYDSDNHGWVDHRHGGTGHWQRFLPARVRW